MPKLLPTRGLTPASDFKIVKPMFPDWGFFVSRGSLRARSTVPIVPYKKTLHTFRVHVSCKLVYEAVDF